MKLFKKALVATAILGAFSTQAATISPVAGSEIKLSAQGIAAGNTAANAQLSFNVIVGKEHPAASTITLTFDSNVDLDTLAAAAGGAVTNDPNTGTGTSGDIFFEYGTGSFTFDNVVIDTSVAGAHTISFDVNLGNPLTANSAFRVTLDGNANLADTIGVVDVSGASTVAYSSVDAADVAIETGTGTLATEVSQFSFSVKTELDAIINRTDNTVYIDTTTTDSLVAVVTNDESLLAALTAPTYTLTVEGDFTGVVADAAAVAANDEVLVTTVGGAAQEIATINVDENAITVPLANTDANTDGTASDVTLAFDHAGTAIPVTGKVDVTFAIDSADLATPLTFAANVDGGEWALDATIINIPYFPVGFEGVSTSVHFANESNAAADVIMTAIDTAGNTYSSSAMADLAAGTVTKLTQTEVMSLFGLTAPTKLSITFNIDADAGDVNAYAFSNAGDARQSLVTSQQKGAGK